jgi:hypothetical protein
MRDEELRFKAQGSRFKVQGSRLKDLAPCDLFLVPFLIPGGEVTG